eukprot:g1466.t1
MEEGLATSTSLPEIRSADDSDAFEERIGRILRVCDEQSLSEAEQVEVLRRLSKRWGAMENPTKGKLPLLPQSPGNGENRGITEDPGGSIATLTMKDLKVFDSCKSLVSISFIDLHDALHLSVLEQGDVGGACKSLVSISFMDLHDKEDPFELDEEDVHFTCLYSNRAMWEAQGDGSLKEHLARNNIKQENMPSPVRNFLAAAFFKVPCHLENL